MADIVSRRVVGQAELTNGLADESRRILGRRSFGLRDKRSRYGRLRKCGISFEIQEQRCLPLDSPQYLFEHVQASGVDRKGFSFRLQRDRHTGNHRPLI